MSKTKATGATKLGRDSQPKYLGVKLFEGEKVRPGMIIIRQRGTKFLPGNNVRKGADDTLYAVKEGLVKFNTRKKKKFDGSQRVVKVVDVVPSQPPQKEKK
ncbi:MAG: 50S ribosomal protein L27 [Candidatus Nealsonbacteria bacterium]